MGCCCNRTDEKSYIQPINFKNKKKFTDCFCFLLFVIFLTGMGIITALAVLDDGYNRLIFGYDSYGNICNKNNANKTLNTQSFKDYDVRGYKYVLYFNYSNPIHSRKVCVKSCPNITINNIDEYKKYSIAQQTTLCFYNVSINNYDPNLCPSFPLTLSRPIAHRCVPSISDLLETEIKQANKIFEKTHDLASKVLNPNITKYFNPDLFKLSVIRLYEQAPKIAFIMFFAFILTVSLAWSLRYIAKTMIISILLITSIGFISLSTFLWLKYVEIKNKNNENLTQVLPLLSVEISAHTAFLIYAIIVTVLTVLILLIIITMRKRIGIVIKLFAEAQKTFKDIPFLFFLPFTTFLFLFGFLFYWLFTALMIYSFGDYTSKEFYFMNISISKKPITTIMWIYHGIALIWVTEFIFGCQSMIIASSVAKWYFTRNKKDLKSPILTSVQRLIVYHMGSVALGSFLITLVRIPRYILMYIQNQTKGQENLFKKFFGKSCICCLWCLEKFIKFINYNAYTIISIEYVSFYSAAKKAFNIIVENNLRIATINSVGDFVLTLSKFAVAATSLVVAYLWLNTDDEEMIYQVLPLTLVGIFAFLIAHCFFTVYEMIVDALLVCFCEDTKANDGSDERPYYMSNSLRKFVDESSSTNIRIN